MDSVISLGKVSMSEDKKIKILITIHFQTGELKTTAFHTDQF
jgi:hypothetical protein